MIAHVTIDGDEYDCDAPHVHGRGDVVSRDGREHLVVDAKLLLDLAGNAVMFLTLVERRDDCQTGVITEGVNVEVTTP